MSWGLFSPRHHSREFQTDIDKGHVDSNPLLSACLPTGIGCPEATLPPSEVLISLVIRKILLGVWYAGYLHFLDRLSHMKADKEGKGAALWCNINRQLSPGFPINRMTCIAERCGHCQRNGPLTFHLDSHIQWGYLSSPPSSASQTLSLEWKFTCLWVGPWWGLGCYLGSQVGRLSHPVRAI